MNPLNAAERMFEQRSGDPSVSALKQDDARQCIEVLRAVRGMANQLGAFDFEAAPVRQSKLNIGGVEVSVRADLLVMGRGRGEDQIGTAILRMTQDDAATDEARAKRREMGLCVATLARMHLDQNLATNRTPTNRLCMSIDLQHGEVFTAPNSNTRRMNDITAACQTIAALWETA